MISQLDVDAILEERGDEITISVRSPSGKKLAPQDILDAVVQVIEDLYGAPAVTYPVPDLDDPNLN